MLKFLIESTSSPQNSTLIPVFSVTEISKISPLTLNCPLPSIKSYLEYPNFTSFCFISSKLYIPPILNSNSFLYNVSLSGIFCRIASIVVTIIKFFFDIIQRIFDIRSKIQLLQEIKVWLMQFQTFLRFFYPINYNIFWKTATPMGFP